MFLNWIVSHLKLLSFSDRNAVLWFGVRTDDGVAESRSINLKNIWSRELTASLIVRSGPPAVDQGPFCIAVGESSGMQTKVSLAPGATTPCIITYRCRENTGQSLSLCFNGMYCMARDNQCTMNHLFYSAWKLDRCQIGHQAPRPWDWQSLESHCRAPLSQWPCQC